MTGTQCRVLFHQPGKFPPAPSSSVGSFKTLLSLGFGKGTVSIFRSFYDYAWAYDFFFFRPKCTRCLRVSVGSKKCLRARGTCRPQTVREGESQRGEDGDILVATTRVTVENGHAALSQVAGLLRRFSSYPLPCVPPSIAL